ncbi:MAG: hypothetical protein AAB920_02215 [Patescibacteria group bacterium]
MSNPKLWKSKIVKTSRFLLIFAVIFGWTFFGQPWILLYAQEATSTPRAATSTPPELQTATSSQTTATQEAATSTATTTPSGLSGQEVTATSTKAQVGEETQTEEIQTEEAPIFAPPPPPLKERKFNGDVRLDKNARHSCQAKSFSVNLSAQDRVIIELELTGSRSDTEDIEIGSLPLGIDITFLNNASYSFSSQKSDSGAVLQITNQPGSQKGNFSVPIIYASGNSTTICQINVINL